MPKISTSNGTGTTPEEQVLAQRRARSLVRGLYFFWPVVKNVDDVERVTLLGYQICIATAFANLVQGLQIIAFSADLFGRASGIFALVVMVGLFFLGANAVRRKSVAAAAFLAVISCLSILDTWMSLRHLEVLPVILGMLMLIVLRGTYLAARWQPSPSETTTPVELQLPFRANKLYSTALTDRWPPRLWPRFQVIFWTFAVLSLLYFCVGVVQHFFPLPAK